MEKEHYIIEDGKLVKATWWKLINFRCKNWIKKWKLVDKYSNKIIPYSEISRYFSLSPIEKETADKLYKEKGTLEYHFYPCGGIAWGIKVKVVKTGEIIDITSYEDW